MTKIAIVGTISNAEGSFESDFRRLLKSCSDFEVALIYIVESDSSDSTVSILQKISLSTPNFKYVSLGDLKSEIPDRISRIRHCRNHYVQELRKLSKDLNLEYVFVADLDGMNSKTNKSAIKSSFLKSDWSAVLANQVGGYYDLLALRHHSWCPTDVLYDLKSEQEKIDKSTLSKLSFYKRLKRRIAFDRARKKAIYSKMLRIRPSSDWIEVASGFGGLGIYRAEIFNIFDYSLDIGDFPYESEHVALSNRITKSGGKIYINPKMVNNFFNTYNVNRFFIVRQIREVYWNTRRRSSSLLKRR